MKKKDTLNDSHTAKERQLLVIPGINVDQGLKRVVGNQTLYVELLQNFNLDFSGAAVEIQSALKKGDLKTAQRLTHTLKGVAGNLGLEVLQDRAAELDGAFKEEIGGDTVENLNDLIVNVAENLTRIVKAIEELSAVGDEVKSSETGEEGGSEKLIEYLKDLEPGLRKQSPKDSNRVLKEMSVYIWPGEYRGQIQDLSAFVRRYRFKEAQNVLNALLEGLNG